MKLVELTEDHLRAIKVRDFELSDLGENYLSDSSDYMASEYKRTLLSENGEVICVFGGQIVSEFTVWTWLLASELINENPVASFEGLINAEKEGIEFFKSKGIKFLHTFNNCDFPFAIRFLERIGYVQKIMQDFNDGKTRVLLLKEI